MKIEEDIATTRIIFTDDDSASVRQSVPASLHKGIGVMMQGAKYAQSFKRGVWDGYIDFYDKKTQTFPTGLLPQVVEVLHKLQQAISFQFTIEDIRPELYVTKVPPVVLHDDKADIKLYEGKFAYQQEAINQIFQEGSGIINASTNAGKCFSGDTKLLTPEGEVTAISLFNEQSIPAKTKGTYLPKQEIKLINRNGDPEKVGALTVNGIKHLIRVHLISGRHLDITDNHPILINPDNPKWIKAKDLWAGASACRLSEDVPGQLIGVTITFLEDIGEDWTYDLSMPETHSFIANGIINHNTEIAAGAIKTILPELKRDERVLFLTNSSVIFNQTIKRLETRLQIPVGAYGGGKHSIKQVTVCTVQTIAKGLDIDPEAKVKLTAKENMTKRIAKRVAPQFMRGANLLMAYKSYLKFFRPETKVDQQMQAILEDIQDECGTDAELGERMRQYVMDYEKIIKTKNKDAYKKHQEAIDLLESAQMLIEDECHHAKSDTFYRIGIGCKNALYRIGLSGTIDKEDEMAWQRLQALFHKIISKVSNDDLIGKGISAKPKVSIVPIMVPHKIKTLKPYAEAYTQGIVTNKFRNNLIASIGASWAVHGKATLIIVNQIAQGEIIGDYLKHPLKGKPTDYEFLTGPESQDEKDRILNRIKSGDCLVMIATSLVDEGLDVSNFRALVMAAGGKSMRQVLQRVGRVLRKKKVGPNKCDVIDFYDEQNNFLLEHSKERIKLYKNEGFELNWVGGEK